MLIIFFLGIKSFPTNGAGELLFRSKSSGKITTFGKDLLLVNVGVESGHLIGLSGFGTLKL